MFVNLLTCAVREHNVTSTKTPNTLGERVALTVYKWYDKESSVWAFVKSNSVVYYIGFKQLLHTTGVITVYISILNLITAIEKFKLFLLPVKIVNLFASSLGRHV